MDAALGTFRVAIVILSVTCIVLSAVIYTNDTEPDHGIHTSSGVYSKSELTDNYQIEVKEARSILTLHDKRTAEGVGERKRRQISRNPSEAALESYCSIWCWSDWYPYSDCSVQCGSSGVQYAHRMESPPPECNAWSLTHDCLGSNEMSRACNRRCYNGGTLESRSCSCSHAHTGTCCETAVECEVLGPINHGHISPVEPYPYGATITYTCDQGYRLVGNQTLTCGEGGIWSESAPSCQIPCRFPEFIGFGSFYPLQRDYDKGTTITYSCDENYELVGHTTLTCVDGGVWSESAPSCLTTCRLPEDITDGHFSPEKRVYVNGTTITYSCDVGYNVEGNDTLTCEERTWNGTAPSCEMIVCGDPGTPTNGSRTTTNGFNYGSTVTFTCNQDSQIKKGGNKERQCQENGRWSGVQPICQVKDCKGKGYGDVHFRTYDGMMIHFQGRCTYVLTQTSLSLEESLDTPPFSVYINQKNIFPRYDVSYTKEIYVSVYGHYIALTTSRFIMVDGNQYGMPLSLNGGAITISADGSYTKLVTDFELTVRYLRRWPSRVEVTVSGRYRDKLEGLCGNCNGIKGDDRQPKNSISRATDPAIGDSWLIHTPYDEQLDCNTPDSPVCEASNIDSSACDRIQTEPVLQGCRDNLGNEAVQEFVDTCKFDVCLAGTEAMCETAEAFVSTCKENLDETVDWRGPFNCPYECPSNSQYSVNITLCPSTCLDQNPAQICHFVPVEGCECRDGFVLSGTSCVSDDECGCIETDGHGTTVNYPNGAEWYSPDCLTAYTCTGGSIVRTSRTSCDTNARCVFANDVYSCVCSQGYQGDGHDCERIPCPYMTMPDNAVVVDCDTLRCSLDCADGYIHTGGDATRDCLLTTEWSGEPLVCSRLPCPYMTVPSNAVVVDCDTLHCSLVCAAQFYQAGGDATRECLITSGSSAWSGETLRCRP